MPIAVGAFNLEISDALIVALEVVYSPTVLLSFTTNKLVPEIAILKSENH